MPHKACFHCNLLFEVDAAHVASMLPCPECGRMLEDHAPATPGGHTQERMIPVDDGGATKMLRVPDLRAGRFDTRPTDAGRTGSQRAAPRHFDVPTQAIALDSIEGSVDVPPPDPSVEIPTQAYRTVAAEADDLDDAPTKALNANALRDAITEGMLDEAPTRHLNAKKLRAGAKALPPSDFDDSTQAWTKESVPADFAQDAPADFAQDAPTRALRAIPDDILTSARPLAGPARPPAGPPPGPPLGASGPVPGRRPSPPSALHGVSGPLPKPRPRPAPAAPAKPPPARPVPIANPAGPPPARPIPAPAAAKPPPARPVPIAVAAPVAAPVAPVAAPVAAPVVAPVAAPVAAPAAAPVPVDMPARLPEPPPPVEGGHSYFNQSRAIDLPDALGALLGDVGEAPAAGGSAPAARSTLARPVRKKSKRTLVVILTTFLIVIAGAVALVVTRDTDPGKAAAVNDADPEAPASEPVDDASAWQKSFDTALTRAKARLPAITQGDDLSEGDFIVASPEGLATHKGPVVGLMNTPFPDGSLETTPAGEQAKPLLGAMRGGGERPLFAAIDRRVKARTVAQILNSAQTAGYTEISLVGRRGGDSGDLIALPVKIFVPGTALPSAGGVELRIGQLGMNAVVKGRDGRPMSGRPATVPRTGGVFDFNALDTLLDKLSSGHPMVRDVVVYVNGDLALETLMGVLGRARGSAARDRFPSISLSVK